ncbi:MAG TPA: cytochrome d ubiquinol oxidase subunit II [Ktedonobacterales bacterium]|nr:cytochrome d ubiquinol oxidase subunit II [Ktedonobacterales bacterium]
MLATISAALVWFALVAYGIFGGADFGGGIWDLLAIGPNAERQRGIIADSMGPVWEANNVWLIFAIVGTFTAFPVVFSSLGVALFIPLTLALIGIVLRGAAFVFRSYAANDTTLALVWGRIFSASSMITPFLFGMSAAAIASGNIHVHNGVVQADFWSTWTTPFAICCGIFALGMCSSLAATYLTVEAQMRKQDDLVEAFRWRAILAGAIAAAFGLFALFRASGDAPYLWHGLTHRGLPFMLGAMAIGLVTAFMLIQRRYYIARILLMLEIASIFVAWATAQMPDLIVPDVTVQGAASPTPVLQAFLIATGVGMVFFLPSLWFLFAVFKTRNPPAQPHPLTPSPS